MRPDFKKRYFYVQLGVIGAFLIVNTALTDSFPNTELIAAVFAFVLAWTKVGRRFLIEFIPLLLILVTYKKVRNFADNLATADVNVTNLIDWELSLFGGMLPCHFVQTHLWDRFFTPALDLFCNTLYLSHFLSPLIIAVLLWQERRSLYWAYAVSIVVISYMSFATYVLFPAAPPWWATLYGHLPDQPVYLDHFVADAERMVKGANPVAAMPSLHAAYPAFIAMVALRVWGRKAWPVVLLPLCVIFATVYLGHHYVIDALAGVAYSLIVFVTLFPWALRLSGHFPLFRKRNLEPAPAYVEEDLGTE